MIRGIIVYKEEIKNKQNSYLILGHEPHISRLEIGENDCPTINFVESYTIKRIAIYYSILTS